MKKLNSFIAVASAISMMSLNYVSDISISAEEIVPEITTAAVPYAEAETFTTTSGPDEDIYFTPSLNGFVPELVDGYYIDFGTPVGDTELIDIYLEDIGDVVSAYGQILFDVTVDDTVYTLRYPWNFEYVESPCLTVNLRDTMNMSVVWNESYMCYFSEMDSDIAEKISEEIRNCTGATLSILYTRDKSSDMPVVTEPVLTEPAGDYPEYTYTYTYKIPAETTIVTTTPVLLAIPRGDVTFNGKVDSADVVAVSAYVGNPQRNHLSKDAIANGDVHNTGDGLTSADALMIQQYLSHCIDKL